MRFLRALPALAIGLMLVLTGAAQAQSVDVELPKLNLPKPDAKKKPAAAVSDVLPVGSLRISATLTDDGAAIESGMIWRVFDAAPEADGKLKLAAKASGGSTEILLAPGGLGSAGYGVEFFCR